ncbi:DUF551 domain-containing protein [Moraxella sp. K2450]|uniref:DUF551 domain-containing protein n=1 Tax=Moraxella sp. K2450 TaxID=2780076 RepID=UPI00187E5287|nr:DUF551 domain-containing protein [Moraxella sp. K2450]MBE9597145.1 DUF551 domain-containing protein [Moraxella sp. K2450]
MNNPKYYLQDASYYHGNYMNWWAKGRQGYTANLDNAHQFTRAEIAEMQARGMRKTDKPWLCSYIDGKSARCVNVSFVSYDEMKEQESILLNETNNGWISVDDDLPNPEQEINYLDDNFEPKNFYLVQLKSGLIDTVYYATICNDCEYINVFISCTLNVRENRYFAQERGFNDYRINEVKFWQPMPQSPKE